MKSFPRELEQVRAHHDPRHPLPHTKRLLRALEGNIKKYESKFGETKLPEAPKEGAPTTYIG